MSKNVVVLGGTSGIGKAIAQRFAYEGYRVLISSSDIGKVNETLAILDAGKHVGIAADVSSDADVDRLTELVKNEFKTIEVLINSVGISKGTPMIGSDYAYWHRSIEVMFYGAIKTTRALVPFMPNNSRIINITSIHHDRVEFNSSAYGMSKAAITQMTRSLAMELASKNILANCIAPGFIETPMSIKADGRNELDSEWFKDNYVKYNHLPLKRAGQPEEVAGVAWFLAGPDASYITGTVITVDGGLTITF